MSVKTWLRSALYSLGVFSFVHRIRNRRTITVFMFHRVLPASSEEYRFAEKEFTFTVDGFCRCLDFIQRHYRVISLDEFKASPGKNTQPRALITFDDGWRDTLVYALPALIKREMPAVLFLSTEAIALEESRWWQDWLVELMAQPGNTEKLSEFFGLEYTDNDKGDLSRLISAKLGELPDAERLKVLHRFSPSRPVERQMLDASDLPKLSPFIRIAGHGHTHGPITELIDPENDLSNSQRVLQSIDADVETMSFPHGAYNEAVLRIARGCGFNVIFSSEPNLVALNRGAVNNEVFGRVHVPENQWTCDERGISFPKLSTFLFFRSIL